MFEKILKWDTDFFIYLNGLGTENLDQFWLIVTDFTTWIPLYIFILFLLFFKNNIKLGLWMLLSFCSMLLLLVCVIVLTKHFVARPRPSSVEALSSVIRVLKKPSDYSFFSGHASSSFAITGLAILFLRQKFKWIYTLLFWPILFTLSRLFVGVHYPLDLLVGTLVGLLFARQFYKMHQKFRAPYIM